MLPVDSLPAPATAAIILAGGTGSRMQSNIPKQFLPLHGKLVVEHSLEAFFSMRVFSEIIVVCEPQYQIKFNRFPSMIFALPGNRRQDSVFNGLQMVSSTCEYVFIHDSARPFLSHNIIQNVLKAGYQHGAAVAAMPVKCTIKESNAQEFVHKTPDRSLLWEIQTPQMAKKDLLKKGFQLANSRNLTVTDDVSLIELLGHPVKIVKGAYTNLKITTAEDLLLAEQIACQLQEAKL